MKIGEVIRFYLSQPQIQKNIRMLKAARYLCKLNPKKYTIHPDPYIGRMEYILYETLPKKEIRVMRTIVMYNLESWMKGLNARQLCYMSHG